MLHRTSDSTKDASCIPTTQTSFPRRPSVTIPVFELESLIQEFLLDCQLRQLTKHSVEGYRNQFKHFLWFMEQQKMSSCSASELKKFLYYLQDIPGDGGRWGKSHLTKPLSPQTAKDYHIGLRRLFNWMVSEDILPFSPMQRVPPPVVRAGLKQPLRQEQIEKMILSARQSKNPERNTAMLLFLFDTGLRAAEVCSLRVVDMDFICRQAKVVGKGNKTRMCYWGIVTAKAISRYLRCEAHSPNSPLFIANGGTGRGGSLTPQGLYKIIREIGEAAGVKCGCHDWRRTFAVNILRNGANLIAVQRLMGHETLSITQGYLNIAQTDIEQQHRQFSPADRLSMSK